MTRQRRRMAVSLIETTVVLSVSATLLLIAVAWIHQSMKVGSVMRDRQEHHQNLMRLSRALRDDVHLGQSMLLDDDERTLVITMNGDRRISYTIDDIGVRRLDGEGDEVSRQETFLLSRTSLARWESSEMPDWIALVVARGTGLERTRLIPKETAAFELMNGPVDLHIRADIGRLDRLASMMTEVKEDAP